MASTYLRLAEFEPDAGLPGQPRLVWDTASGSCLLPSLEVKLRKLMFRKHDSPPRPRYPRPPIPVDFLCGGAVVPAGWMPDDKDVTKPCQSSSRTCPSACAVRRGAACSRQSRADCGPPADPPSAHPRSSATPPGPGQQRRSMPPYRCWRRAACVVHWWSEVGLSPPWRWWF